MTGYRIIGTRELGDDAQLRVTLRDRLLGRRLVINLPGDPIITSVNVARAIGAHDVCLPSIPRDAAGTILVVEEAYRWVDDLPTRLPFSLIAVPAGRTIHEWVACWTELIGLVIKHASTEVVRFGISAEAAEDIGDDVFERELRVYHAWMTFEALRV